MGDRSSTYSANSTRSFARSTNAGKLRMVALLPSRAFGAYFQERDGVRVRVRVCGIFEILIVVYQRSRE